MLTEVLEVEELVMSPAVGTLLSPGLAPAQLCSHTVPGGGWHIVHWGISNTPAGFISYCRCSNYDLYTLEDFKIILKID